MTITDARFIRPDVRKAATAEQAYTEAHEHLTCLLDRIQAVAGGTAHRRVNGNWGHAGDIQRAIDLATELHDVLRGRSH